MSADFFFGTHLRERGGNRNPPSERGIFSYFLK